MLSEVLGWAEPDAEYVRSGNTALRTNEYTLQRMMVHSSVARLRNVVNYTEQSRLQRTIKFQLHQVML